MKTRFNYWTGWWTLCVVFVVAMTFTLFIRCSHPAKTKMDRDLEAQVQSSLDAQMKQKPGPGKCPHPRGCFGPVADLVGELSCGLLLGCPARDFNSDRDMLVFTDGPITQLDQRRMAFAEGLAQGRAIVKKIRSGKDDNLNSISGEVTQQDWDAALREVR